MTDIFTKYDLVDVDESFPIPELPEEGLVLVYGTSGSGKTTILNKYFGNTEIVFNDEPLYKNFSTPESAEQYLIACGLRTIPAWKRSYHTLSNGEKHRAYCAKSLELGIGYIDEFTSVVDRDTGKALSYAIQKYYRENRIKRLVIASCHSDIIEWLNPDYVYNTDSKSWEGSNLPRGCLWRPKIEIEIKSVVGSVFWEIFKKHHYLSGQHNKSANAFVAFIKGKPVGFCSILRFPNKNFSNAWRGHRTVILPEFQGLGIGAALSDTIAQMVIDSGGRFFSKTSHPAFGSHRDNSSKWKPTTKNKKSRKDYSEYEYKGKEDKYKMQHKHRVCYSHEYIGESAIKK